MGHFAPKGAELTNTHSSTPDTAHKHLEALPKTIVWEKANWQ